MNRLIKVMEDLRSPDGCPWDKKQTLESLTSCLLEEAYEVIDAILEKKNDKVAEELGDLMCIISMMIVIGEESHSFDKKRVIGSAVKKMKHRHPHVFGDAKARTSDSAHTLWHKAKEKEENVRSRKSVLDDLNKHFPALHRADKIGRRVARVGFDWPNVSSAVKKIEEELEEVRSELRAKRPAIGRITEELGDLLFATVNVARKLKINAEIALRKTNNKFIKRFQKVETVLKRRGKSPETVSLEEMDTIWEDIKAKRKKKV